eukprot:11156720-Alexandrium_andersonii.AAC.1
MLLVRLRGIAVRLPGGRRGLMMLPRPGALRGVPIKRGIWPPSLRARSSICLLYTSDAADDM